MREEMRDTKLGDLADHAPGEASAEHKREWLDIAIKYVEQQKDRATAENQEKAFKKKNKQRH